MSCGRPCPPVAAESGENVAASMPLCCHPTLKVYVVCPTVWSSGVMLYVMLACRYPVRLLCTTLCCLSACPVWELNCSRIYGLKSGLLHAT